MLTALELFIPAAIIVLISLPLISVFKGNKSIKSAKRRMISHVCLFAMLLIGTVVFQIGGYTASAAEAPVVNQIAGTLAQGLGFLAAALATGMSALGAGIAVAAAAPAAIGAFSENAKNFGKSLIFVALGEGVAIYGLIISILIIIKL
ncbi:MAG: ATPase [Erysipelotrichaceae bacterium]